MPGGRGLAVGLLGGGQGKLCSWLWPGWAWQSRDSASQKKERGEHWSLRGSQGLGVGVVKPPLPGTFPELLVQLPRSGIAGVMRKTSPKHLNHLVCG